MQLIFNSQFICMLYFAMRVLIALGFLVGSCLGQGGAPIEYVLNFDSPVYVCPDDASKAFIDTTKIDVQRVDDNAVLTGFVNFLQGMEANTMLEIQIEKEASNRYEMVFSHEICDLCGEIEDDESNYKGYLKFFGFPDKCPFEPQEYHIHDFVADTSDLPVNGQNAGAYQATLNMYKTNGDCKEDKTLLACMKIDFVIEPGH